MGNNGQAPDVVWCVAGSAHPSIYLETSRSIKRQQMDINYWSCADMAQAILSEWLAPGAVGKGGQKHLIFTSSVAAFYPLAGYASYAPAKAAIKCLSDSLAQEILLSWIIAIVWFFVPIDMDGKVRKYGKKHGHP